MLVGISGFYAISRIHDILQRHLESKKKALETDMAEGMIF